MLESLRSQNWIDVSIWEKVDNFEQYPEGARVKSLLRSPAHHVSSEIFPNKKYLIKYSREGRNHQFWGEILASMLGEKLGIKVTHALPAQDENGCFGALIGWFLEDDPGTPYPERKEPGGDLLQSIKPDFERKKGKDHSWQLVKRLFTSSPWDKRLPQWRQSVFEMLTFDALIGNTDRHQDNWMLP